MNRYLVISLLVLAGLANPLNAAVTLYVSSKQAKLYKEANFNSDLIASLKQNDVILLVEQKGIWMQVNYSDIFGWTSRYSVTSTKPSNNKVSISSRLLNFFKNENRRDRLTLVSTAGGIRGFSSDESDASGSKDFEAVGKMEAVTVSEGEVEKFVASNAN